MCVCGVYMRAREREGEKRKRKKYIRGENVSRRKDNPEKNPVLELWEEGRGCCAGERRSFLFLSARTDHCCFYWNREAIRGFLPCESGEIIGVISFVERSFFFLLAELKNLLGSTALTACKPPFFRTDDFSTEEFIAENDNVPRTTE